MDKKARWSLVAFILALPVVAFFWWTRPQPPLQDVAEIVLPDGTEVSAEIAATPEERGAGLSGRTELPDGTGMLFIFDQPGLYPFWMRAMNFPIDIVWIMDTTVVSVAPDVSAALADQLKTKVSSGPANRVLELPAGYAEAHGVVAGATLDIRLPTR
jgi:uncharacterized membrane protein (UPF0127 family)